ncbi:UTP--glucose-1-phosphate uridylyltransferase 3, chloroplastic isoform X2 [Populus trichocarpa]|uniref:UTP--glucose-1-phosphate uridylyltransferase 3, chloroplastic isoform X2 n=1 Tax=Populus trichocarpa TaxID=3694 RepID=UPI000D189A67|nr:UTP--glucose-1-phosphate uridylyltransferase 3, chloroplastic isoform X2 [Populus trichocarpa]|eukprot:XP_024466052.1 UTP--glucose-1-phosphate uridylyltransferase 3, chloroplastic isoform X2 [Populus trichocarpa]
MAKTNAATSSSTNILLRYNNKKRNDFLFSFNSINLFNKSLPFKKPSLHPPLLSLSSSPSKPLTTRVSIAPVEYAPPAPDSFNFHQEISRLQSLRSKLAHSKTLNGKQSVLNDDSRVKRFFKIGGVSRFLDSINLTSRELFLLKCLVAAGQEHVVSLEGFELVESEAVESVRTSVKSALYSLVEIIEGFDLSDNGNKGLERINYGENLTDEEIKDLKKLLKSLGEVEEFYDCIGGVIGYQIMVLELLFQSTFKKQTTNWSQHIKESMECQFLEIHAPSGLDLSKNTEYASQAALWGIEGLPDLGEIYPLGGSADRLGLVDPDTGECLPAAMLPYCGRTLLEGLIRDLQAREFLYFKIYGKQCITPVAIMTSSAKNNHEHITSLCERLSWFGRAISAEDGQWLVTKPFAPVCKPGGHGVIWKLAYDKGIFEWFYDHDRKGATVRQVSNVVAATDLTLLALAGIGLRHRKKLGFASCKRNSGATEGINVLIEKKNLDGQWAYGLSCIEYTEFDKFEITGGPCSTNGLQAEFPANTNILYVDLPSLELVASSNNEKSLPGMVLNTKKPIVYMDHYGNCHSVYGGRLECTMQNIADNFTNTYLSRCYKGVEDKLDTFIVYNERRRVTSSAKRKRRHSDNTLHQTPDGALLDILRNAYDLLSHCDIELPQIEGNDKYVESGPPFLIYLHPALGPLWEVTRQKFNGGSISKGSELQIEVAEFSWRNVQLDGSLIIIAENVMGSTRIDPNGEPILQYGNRCGRCRLQNVKVVNKGINWSFGDNIYWKHDVQRFEALKVILHGNAEFEADNVTIQGNQIFEIPDGYKMKITSGDSGLQVQLNPLEQKIMDSGSWHWNYKIHGSHIQLELVET